MSLSYIQDTVVHFGSYLNEGCCFVQCHFLPFQNPETYHRRSAAIPKMKNYTKMIKNEKHFTSVLNGFSEAFVTGKFCDVKVVCKVRLVG
jgi:hypothetical protein